MSMASPVTMVTVAGIRGASPATLPCRSIFGTTVSFIGTLQANGVGIATQACTAKQNRFKGLGRGEQKTKK